MWSCPSISICLSASLARDLCQQRYRQSSFQWRGGSRHPFWQARYYDFNVFTESKRTEKLDYMHYNPVKRGLVENMEQWPWSSYRSYCGGEAGRVQVERAWIMQWNPENPGLKSETWVRRTTKRTLKETIPLDQTLDSTASAPVHSWVPRRTTKNLLKRRFRWIRV
jgi:hypothetical protein